MARVTGPLMSMEASGSLAKTLVFAKWKGRPYTRAHVVPANPKSMGQVATRACMTFLTQEWANLSGAEQASWDDLGAAGSFSAFNAYVRFNMRRFTLLDSPTQEYPAAEASAAVALTSITSTGGVGLISHVIVNPANVNVWGVMVFVDTAAIAPSRTQIRIVPPIATAQTITVETGGLDPGTYHVKAATFNVDGKTHSALVASADAVVT